MGRARRLCLPVPQAPHDTIQGVDCQIRRKKWACPPGKIPAACPRKCAVSGEIPGRFPKNKFVQNNENQILSVVLTEVLTMFSRKPGKFTSGGRAVFPLQTEKPGAGTPRVGDLWTAAEALAGDAPIDGLRKAGVLCQPGGLTGVQPQVFPGAGLLDTALQHTVQQSVPLADELVMAEVCVKPELQSLLQAL